MINSILRRVLTLPFILLMLVLSLSISACSGQTASATNQNAAGLDITMQADAPKGMEQLLNFTLINKDKQPVDGATVEIEGNMNHAGMVPVNVKAEGRGNGVYVSTIKYTMTGQWSLTVTARTANGDRVTKIFPMNVRQ